MPGFAATRAGTFCQRVTQIGAGLFRRGFELLDNVRMLRGNIGGFADVVGEIVEFLLFDFAVRVRHGQAVAPAGFAGQPIENTSPGLPQGDPGDR
jgi:hypothetical protein